jgi:hypothetical protein
MDEVAKVLGYGVMVLCAFCVLQIAVCGFGFLIEKWAEKRAARRRLGQ